ncbi:MAG: DUF4465 domain-containing protein [Pirellulales bacterium]|nr:DUF4465 domain-containing protein [Pirellulales bacterium]
MTHFLTRQLIVCLLLFCAIDLSQARAATITLEDQSLLPNSQRNNPAFVSGGAAFNNFYDAGTDYWAGWAVSTQTDITTAGYFNQYSAYALPAGGGAGGSSTYALTYLDGITIPRITLPAGSQPVSLQVANTTYAALSMRDGDSFVGPKFGGTDGNLPDFLLLKITGLNALNQPVGTPIDFYLADFRFADNSLDYMLTAWTNVDLTPLAGATQLTFAISGSRNNNFGLLTPAYFALDNLEVTVIPEPGLVWATVAILCLGGIGLLIRKSPRAATVSIFFCTGSLLLLNSTPAVAGPFSVAPIAAADPAIIHWASEVSSYQPAADLDPATQMLAHALGPANGNIVSLGDLTAAQITAGIPAGRITLGFATPFVDGPGWDLAVFENAGAFFTAPFIFGELGYVEVSSNGVDFARFASESLNVEQGAGIPGDTELNVAFGRAFAGLNVTNTRNLAGVHASLLGTPFDLGELATHPLVSGGLLDLQNVRYVRIIDVPGNGAFLDSQGRPILDPWPGTGNTAGFDLDAVGVRYIVPEPGMLLMACAGLAAWAWRRGKKCGVIKGI